MYLLWSIESIFQSNSFGRALQAIMERDKRTGAVLSSPLPVGEND